MGERLNYPFSHKIQQLTAIALALFALTYCSSMTGGPEGPKATTPVGGPVAAANGGGILSAPIDDDLMEDSLCFLPYLRYGADFASSYNSSDWASWHVESGSTFSGKFMLTPSFAGASHEDIQVRVVHSNTGKTLHRYRDFRFAKIPPEGQSFEVTIDKVGFGDYVEFFISPRKKIPDSEDETKSTCSPSNLVNFSESWTTAGSEDDEKSLGLLARFKIFTSLDKMEVLEHPELSDPDFKTAP